MVRCLVASVINNVTHAAGDKGEVLPGPPPLEPLTWIRVPEARLLAFYEDYFGGRLSPTTDKHGNKLPPKQERPATLEDVLPPKKEEL
jgi:hypothetical protein